MQLKHRQGLDYIIKLVSTPLIHLIHFAQLSLFYEYGIAICDTVSLVTLRARCIPINMSQKREKKLNRLKTYTVGVQ